MAIEDNKSFEKIEQYASLWKVLRRSSRVPHVPLIGDSGKEKGRLDQNRRAGLLPSPGIPKKVSLSLS